MVLQPFVVSLGLSGRAESEASWSPDMVEGPPQPAWSPDSPEFPAEGPPMIHGHKVETVEWLV